MSNRLTTMLVRVSSPSVVVFKQWLDGRLSGRVGQRQSVKLKLRDPWMPSTGSDRPALPFLSATTFLGGAG